VLGVEPGDVGLEALDALRELGRRPGPRGELHDAAVWLSERERPPRPAGRMLFGLTERCTSPAKVVLRLTQGLVRAARRGVEPPARVRDAGQLLALVCREPSVPLLEDARGRRGAEAHPCGSRRRASAMIFFRRANTTSTGSGSSRRPSRPVPSASPDPR